MNTKLIDYVNLSELFKKNGFSLWLVGGTVRDYLLEIEINDMDAVTNATPKQMKEFLSDYKFDDTFSHLGAVKLKFNSTKFDIVTLRKEKRYKDARHPLKVKFIKKLKRDVKRRDFTLNAMYLNSSFCLIDYVNGRQSINNKTINMVGNPVKRLKEDPLRIIRALRFAATYDFSLDSKLTKAINKTSNCLSLLNKDKIIQDLKKANPLYKDRLINLFNNFSISWLIEMID